MNKTTINCIILSNTQSLELYGMTQRTINSLRWSEEKYNFNIIIVESNKHLLQNGFIYNDCKVVKPQEEFGYNKFLNYGLKECIKDTKVNWFIIANNDLIFTQHWFTKLMNYHNNHPDVLSLCPWEPIWHQKRGLKPNHPVYLGYRTSYEITGWCLVIHKSVIEKCELFDPQFKFWYQDNDYALTLQKYDVKHALVTNSKVYHMVSGSHHLLTNENKYDMTDGQLQILKNKWGNKI